MIFKYCPWCQHQLRIIELLLLDEHSPRTCKNCGKFLRNATSNSTIAVALPIVLFGVSIYFFDIHFLLSLMLLLLIPILRVTLAEPLKFIK